MLDPATTALILIDLQKGIVANPVGPRPGSEVVGNASRLADRFRSLGSPVFLVRVAFSEDGKDALRPPAAVTYPSGERPADWGPRSGDWPEARRFRHYEAPVGSVPWHGTGPAA